MEANELVERLAKAELDREGGDIDWETLDQEFPVLARRYRASVLSILSRLHALGLVVMPKTATEEMVFAMATVDFSNVVDVGAIRLPSPSEEQSDVAS